MAMTLARGFGPMAFARLLQAYGNPADAMAADPVEVMLAGQLTKNTCEDWRPELLLKKADEEIAAAERAGVRLVPFLDEAYPALLKQIFDPPVLLYVRGNVEALNTPALAIVGSRDSSLYGRRMASGLGRDIAAAGVTVVSGLARGIDTAAHEGALEADGRTVAVLAGGLAGVYPPENVQLAETIVRRGALVSEYPLRMQPQAGFFPVRNRIISGLSRGVLVVEANRKSGALITADAALEQGRDVFAVPANADSAKSAGSNRLLKQGAKFVTEAIDVLEELGFAAAPARKSGASAPGTPLAGDEASVLDLFDSEPLDADTLSEKSSLPVNRVMAALSTLEMKRYLTQLPGKQFVKIN